MDIGALMVRIEGDAEPLARSLGQAEKGLGLFSKNAGREFDGMSRQFSRLFTDVVQGDIKGISTALLSLVASVAKGNAGSGGGLLDGVIGIGGTLLGGLSQLLGRGRASGGAITAGQPTLVGEHGPEIFTPYGSGQVTPNHAIGGGRPINLTMHIATPDAASFRASQGQILAEAAQSLARAQRFY